MIKLQKACSAPLDCTSICPANKTHKDELNLVKFIREDNTTPILCCCNWCCNPRPHTRGTSSFSYRQLYYESSCHNHQNTGNANAHEGTQLWNRQVDSTVTVQLTWCELFLVLDSKFCWHCYCFRPKKGPGEMAQWERVHNVITRDQDSVSSTRKQSTAACYSSSKGSKVPYLQAQTCT